MRRRPRPGGAAQAGEARPSPQCSRGRPTWSGSKLTAELGDTLALPECRCKGSVGATTASRRCRAPERRRSLVRAKRKRNFTALRRDRRACRARRGIGVTSVDHDVRPVRRQDRGRRVREAAEPAAGAIRGRRLPLRLTRSAARSPEPSPHWARSNPGPVLVPIASASGQPSWPCWTTGKSVPVNAFARRS
jgi:hypothetical protein